MSYLIVPGHFEVAPSLVEGIAAAWVAIPDRSRSRSQVVIEPIEVPAGDHRGTAHLAEDVLAFVFRVGGGPIADGDGARGVTGHGTVRGSRAMAASTV
jgi:hypothetical protein